MCDIDSERNGQNFVRGFKRADNSIECLDNGKGKCRTFVSRQNCTKFDINSETQYVKCADIEGLYKNKKINKEEYLRIGRQCIQISGVFEKKIPQLCNTRKYQPSPNPTRQPSSPPIRS
jgi:hypothetical protein